MLTFNDLTMLMVPKLEHIKAWWTVMGVMAGGCTKYSLSYKGYVKFRLWKLRVYIFIYLFIFCIQYTYIFLIPVEILCWYSHIYMGGTQTPNSQCMSIGKLARSLRHTPFGAVSVIYLRSWTPTRRVHWGVTTNSWLLVSRCFNIFFSTIPTGMIACK